MANNLMLVFVALIFTVGGLGLRACNETAQHGSRDTVYDEDVTVLKNGTVVLAPDGTVARALTDWLDRPDTPERTFNLGGVQFAGRSTEPTSGARKRMPALVKMLTAYPEVRAHFVGYTQATSNSELDESVATARAQWAVDTLAEAGIERDRLSVEGRSAAGVQAGETTERVDLRLRVGRS